MSNEERYNKILEKNTSTLNLISDIEKSQKRRKIQNWIKKMWNKLLGRKNVEQKRNKEKIL